MCDARWCWAVVYPWICGGDRGAHDIAILTMRRVATCVRQMFLTRLLCVIRTVTIFRIDVTRNGQWQMFMIDIVALTVAIYWFRFLGGPQAIAFASIQFENDLLYRFYDLTLINGCYVLLLLPLMMRVQPQFGVYCMHACSKCARLL